jgi:hypothetical protein
MMKSFYLILFSMENKRINFILQANNLPLCQKFKTIRYSYKIMKALLTYKEFKLKIHFISLGFFPNNKIF